MLIKKNQLIFLPFFNLTTVLAFCIGIKFKFSLMHSCSSTFLHGIHNLDKNPFIIIITIFIIIIILLLLLLLLLLSSSSSLILSL